MWRGIFSRREPLDVTEKVDRQRFYQNRRLICGIHVGCEFQEILGSLIMVEGCGKWLNVQVVETVQTKIPEVIGRAARQLFESSSPDLAELHDLNIDLTEVYCQLIWQLKACAGKAADQILAACIDDPGLWTCERNKRYLMSFCAPDALAEKSGITIVDALPARDAAVGGNGYPLRPLPFWLMFAERNEKVSQVNRVVVMQSTNEVELTYLPASDGLDREFPPVRWQACHEADFDALKKVINTWQNKAQSDNNSEHPTNLEVIFVGNRVEESSQWFEQHSDWSVRDSRDFGIDPENIAATVAAILGLANLDQMPVNIPDLTGAECPRTLGRTTPGRPSNWRRVLLNMADYRPPAMKLRDAI